MAVNDTFYGKNFVERTPGESKVFPPVKIPPGEEVGDVGMAYDEYDLDGILATDDIIQMMFLPAGARIIEATLKFADMGTGAVLSVGFIDPATGDLDTTGEIFDGIGATPGNQVLMTGFPARIANMHKVSENTPGWNADLGGVMIGVKFTTAGTATTGAVKLAIYSVRD